MSPAHIQCTNCKQPYPEEGVPYCCPRCGGVFDYSGPLRFDPSQVEPELAGIWRFRHTFDLPDNAPTITLGEGTTPLVWAEAFGRQVAFKCEFQNPSGSFKDRGSALLASFLRSRGVEIAVEDSSGNAGASFAAYAARAGIRARIFVPFSASGPKRAQIEAYGAEVVGVPGARSNAAEAARRAADEGAIYASHAYLPFNIPGYATAAYEIVEQMGGAPGAVVTPVGQGGLFIGLWRGFEAMQRAGRLTKMPLLIGVQARACAPLWALYTYGAAGLQWVSEGETLAEGIRVSRPLRGDVLLKCLDDKGGMMVAVDEDEIVSGRDQLARRGFYVEMTSAVVWGALAQVIQRVPEPVVVVLTGSGLKTPVGHGTSD
jgi:threonine synthase